MKLFDTLHQDIVHMSGTTDFSHMLLMIFVFLCPALLGLLGPLIDKFEDGTIQNKIKNILKLVHFLFKKIQRRKLRPAVAYLKHQLAAIRTLFI